jgi:hypothetical protein
VVHPPGRVPRSRFRITDGRPFLAQTLKGSASSSSPYPATQTVHKLELVHGWDSVVPLGFLQTLANHSMSIA